MLKRLWADHRWSCLLTLALLVLSVVVSPWVLLAAVVPVGWAALTDRSIIKSNGKDGHIDFAFI